MGTKGVGSIGGLAGEVGTMRLAKHPVEEAGRLVLFGWLRVVQGKRVLQFMLGHGAVDIYNVGALVGVVSM